MQAGQAGRLTENGERVITGSRRPDGTFRKDIRVRAGYVPQEEQEVYVSKAALSRQGVPKVPGLDEAELAASKTAAKTRAAKKNDKRKQKKTQEPEGAATAESVTAQLASSRIGGGTAGTAGDPLQASGDTALSPIERQVRATRKKLKQAELLIAKQQEGQPLTEPEKAKIEKAAAWRAEIQSLEERL